MNDRIRQLNDKPVLDTKTCVLYVMGRDQRVVDNHALAAAQTKALELALPLAVVFCLQPSTGYRAREHYEFMLAGLRELEQTLADCGIPFMMLIGPAGERLQWMMHHVKPAVVYFDFSPLRGPLKIHIAIAANAACAVYEVDTHNIVPVWTASDHQEFGARTLRPKLNRLLADYLADEAPALRQHPHVWPGPVITLASLQPMIDELLAKLPINDADISRFKSGELAAQAALDGFIDRLADYAELRNDPVKGGESDLSPYLHFGQLSSARVVRCAEAAANHDGKLRAGADTLIEQIVIRKELTDNFCFYNRAYDKLAGAPQWARMKLQNHLADEREFTYDLQQLETASTHDPAWNAAQRQLTKTGKMHNYMRMYWAKKVLEWSTDPETALKNLICLNDFYSLDGGDPNGYVGILWSVAGLHDRPWPERRIYGTIRSMVYNGLKRKFDIETYEIRW